jgi:hypothetical protein
MDPNNQPPVEPQQPVTPEQPYTAPATFDAAPAPVVETPVESPTAFSAPVESPVAPVPPAEPTVSSDPLAAPPVIAAQVAAVVENPGHTLGIVSLVTALLGFNGIAIVIGAIGLNKSKKNGQKNGLALAGIIIGSVEIALALIIIIVIVVMAATAPTPQ